MKAVRVVAVFAFGVLVGCATESAESEAADTAATSDELRVLSSFQTRGTGYYPANTALEGGFLDRKGKRLNTLQQFLAGTVPYVSVAMDTTAFPYGQRLRLKEFNARYGREIIFRVVDTGGAFRGKGRSRIDICTANEPASLDRTVNSLLNAEVIDEGSGPAPSPTPGATCSNDGACNPGSDGSGKICVSGKCVEGCRSNAQCPGSTVCTAGFCK
jgi:3D (Asp-Asp-Asp) domain-containing protein